MSGPFLPLPGTSRGKKSSKKGTGKGLGCTAGKGQKPSTKSGASPDVCGDKSSADMAVVSEERAENGGTGDVAELLVEVKDGPAETTSKDCVAEITSKDSVAETTSKDSAAETTSKDSAAETTKDCVPETTKDCVEESKNPLSSPVAETSVTTSANKEAEETSVKSPKEQNDAADPDATAPAPKDTSSTSAAEQGRLHPRSADKGERSADKGDYFRPGRWSGSTGRAMWALPVECFPRGKFPGKPSGTVGLKEGLLRSMGLKMCCGVQGCQFSTSSEYRMRRRSSVFPPRPRSWRTRASS